MSEPPKDKESKPSAYRAERLEKITKKGNDAIDDFYNRHGEWDGIPASKKKLKQRDHS
jgi:hypothetical protein